MRRVLVAVVGVLSLAPAAHAEPRFRDVGPVVAGPFTDGQRWAAWSPVRGKLTLFDTARGRAWTQPLPARCELAGLGGGRLLLLCPPPGYQYDNLNRPVLVDLRTGASWEPPGVDSAWAPTFGTMPDDVMWTGVGARWLRFTQSGYHWALSGYLDTATGRIASDPASTLRQPSLDAPGLLVRLCSPVRRPRNPDIDAGLGGDPLLTLDYEPPWALLPLVSERTGTRTVWLAFCGRTTKRRVCGGECVASLSAGVVTWATRAEVGALVIGSGRRLRWRLQGGVIVHTANRIFVRRWRTDAARLLMARLPR